MDISILHKRNNDTKGIDIMSIFCRNCGAQLSDTAKFCNKCGTAVVRVEDNKKSEAKPEPEQTVTQAPESGPVVPPEQQKSPIPTPAEMNAKPGKNPSKLVPVILIILIILILAFDAVMLFTDWIFPKEKTEESCYTAVSVSRMLSDVNV